MEHCPDKNNELPDLLSRDPEDQDVGDLPELEVAVPPTLNAIQTPLIAIVKEAQQADPETREKVQLLADRNHPEWELYDRLLEIEDGFLYHEAYRNQGRGLYVPLPARARVLYALHD